MIAGRWSVLAALVTLLPAALASEVSAEPLALGAAAPAAGVKMKNVDGRELSIQDVTGKKGTLVVFSCNHCPWAKGWEERIVKLGNEYVGKGIGVVVINSNDPAAYPEDSFDEMKRRAADRGYAFPYVVDATSEVARAFGASHTPEVFLFDGNGKLAYYGAVDDNMREPDKVEHTWLADALAAVAAGQEVATKETKALGCSIKFRS